MDVITTHLNADFDGFASMVAARKLYPGALLVFPGGAQETVRSFLALHDLGITRLKDLRLQDVTRLILVDTQEPERLGPLQSLCANPAVALHIFDHHPDDDEDTASQGCRAAFKVVEEVGATVTLLVERLQQQGMSLSPLEATVLALGLYEETGSFAYPSTTPRDLHAAAAVLQAGADLTLVADLLRHPLQAEHIALLNELLQGGETFYLEGRKILLATSIGQHMRGELAEVVHRLAELKGLDAVIAAIAIEDRIEIIARSRRANIDVAQIAAAFGGGGHHGAAAATVKDATMVEVHARLLHLLTERYRPTLLARDVMTTPVKTIGDEASIALTEHAMTRYGVNVLPVLDRQGHYCGVVARETVQKALFHNLGATPVQSVLQAEVYTATPETPFHAIEQYMLERNQRCVPILTGSPSAQTVVGVITRTDLLRTLHDDVLASARLRAKGEPLPELPLSAHRNMQGVLRGHLPGPLYALLGRIGQLADAQGVGAYVVGGCVRDLLLGRRNLDVDIVVEGDGLAFARALAQQEGAQVTTHARFGTAVVTLPDGFKLDVATARTEYYEYPTALPTVEQSSIKKDLYRRDFTINALAICLHAPRFGVLLDFYGGQRDLKEHTLRVLHSLSFVEDPTRILRAVRFEKRFGLQVGKETLRLIKGAVSMDLFHRLSGARLGEELRLLLAEPEARSMVARLAEFDLLRFLHAELSWSARLDQALHAVDEMLAWYRMAALHWPDHAEQRLEPWLVRFLALLEPLSDAALEETVQRLQLSTRQTATVHAARAARRLIPQLARRPQLSPAEAYRLLTGQPLEALLFVMASTASDTARQQLVAYLETYRHVKAALSGHDLQAMGLPPGPGLGAVLARLLEARLNGEVSTVPEERALARHLIQSQAAPAAQTAL
ncbi:MAG: CBS domain-containing protein [Candidatus Tectimicrobiota bacterium]